MYHTATTVRLILGDQLNQQHSWFEEVRDDVVYLLAESRSETDYVRHHIQKVIGFFLAMRHFATWLEQQGHRVHYIRLDDAKNAGPLIDNIRQVLSQYQAQAFAYQLPDEYRLDDALTTFCAELPIATQVADTEHFYTERMAVRDRFAGKKTYLMESFYRAIRRRENILMEADGETPLTGRWNYDAENRNRIPRQVAIPPDLLFARDVTDLVTMLEQQGVKTMGTVDAKQYVFPVTREECLELLAHFVQHKLRDFGTYQDSMTQRDDLLFHSKLSFAMNTKQLSPREVVDAAIAEWQTSGEFDIAQVEGYVRQIIGWREFMRGVYWAQMPAYAEKNFFGADAELPEWYWTADTKMACLQHAIRQSLDMAYAHHIQRLMLTGNFALIYGAHPDEVDKWYLGVYIDAIEWVEITNTRGMSQFADGGLVATKPYCSSANYINKMSDYCRGCYYDHKKRHGERACPFNSFYWDFLTRHEQKLRNNPRIGLAYRAWDRMEAAERVATLEQAATYRATVNDL